MTVRIVIVVSKSPAIARRCRVGRHGLLQESIAQSFLLSRILLRCAHLRCQML